MSYRGDRHRGVSAAPRGVTRAHGRLVARLVVCMALAAASIGHEFVGAAVPVRAAQPASSGVVFRGPSRGAPGPRTPQGAAFVTNCSANVNRALGTVDGTAVLTGTAVEAASGCGSAVLPLDVSGLGRFHARFGVSDDDTSGQQAVVRINVLDPNGFNLYTGDVTAQRGRPGTIDLDVTHAVAIKFSFLKRPTTYLYGARLTGGARSLTPVQAAGNTLPAGATPVNMATVGASCNINKVSSTTALTVTFVGIPAAGALAGTACGAFTLAFPAHARGTLVLRYGADDTGEPFSDLTLANPDEFLYARAFDATGRLLRKATGVAAVGAGLQPLWLDLSGARTVQLAIDGSSAVKIDITSVGVLPGRVAPFVTPNRVQSGGSPRGSVAIDPRDFASLCNVNIRDSDAAVARRPILGGTYLSTFSCGSASLFFCCTNAEGVFHARFGVPDTETAGKPATVTVIVKDKDDHVLLRRSYSALGGTPGARMDLPLRIGASIVSFAFGGVSGLLYDLRLTGIATISERIYPPTEPPIDVPHGVAINPHDFAVHCEAKVATQDQRLVGATTLEGWALSGIGDAGCVSGAATEADLALAGTHYPRHAFYARVGIDLGEPPATIVTFHFNVLNGAGKVLRAVKVDARYGYGPQPVHLSLKNGATVQIVWDAQRTGPPSGTAVYAMTAV